MRVVLRKKIAIAVTTALVACVGALPGVFSSMSALAAPAAKAGKPKIPAPIVRPQIDESKVRAFLKSLEYPANKAEIVAASERSTLPEGEKKYLAQELPNKKYWSAKEALGELGLRTDDEP